MSSKRQKRSTENSGKDESTNGSKVGYCKPPRRHQFKPGQSGYPSGRPRGRRNRTTIERELLGRKITVNWDGKAELRTVGEAILLKQIFKALSGDSKAAKYFLDMLEPMWAEKKKLDELQAHIRSGLTVEEMAEAYARVREATRPKK